MSHFPPQGSLLHFALLSISFLHLLLHSLEAQAPPPPTCFSRFFFPFECPKGAHTFPNRPPPPPYNVKVQPLLTPPLTFHFPFSRNRSFPPPPLCPLWFAPPPVFPHSTRHKKARPKVILCLFLYQFPLNYPLFFYLNCLPTSPPPRALTP